MSGPRPAPEPDDDDARTPKATHAERLLVQFMVAHPACVPDVLDAGFVPEDCYTRDFREVARLVLHLHARQVIPHWHVVSAALKSADLRLDDPLDFNEFDEGVPRPDPAGLTYFVGVLKDRGRRRKLLLATRKVRSGLADPDIPLAEALATFETDMREATADGASSPHAPGTGAPFVEALPDLLARLDTHPAPSWLVPGLLPDHGTILLHSQPREWKTLIALHFNLALATDHGRALGLIDTGPAVPTWYLSDEDGWHPTAQRFAAMLAGAGLTAHPPLLHTSIGKGINLDDLDWQEAIIAQAVQARYRLVTFDPLRSLTAAADQGPRELKPIVTFIRRLMREAGCVVMIVHHDTKPGEKPDQRRRPQRASGGGIFSIADAPIHIETIDQDRRLLVPTAYKFCADPAPITLTLEHGDGWLRLVGTAGADTGSAEHAALDARILEFLKHSPYTYGSKVAAGVHASKSDVLARLKALEAAGAVDAVDEDRGTKWLLARRSAA